MGQYSFKNKNTYIYPGSNVPVTELEDFAILNGGNIRHFEGLYFPVKYAAHYGNTIMDFIASYLELKKTYSNLKIIFLKSDVIDRFKLSNIDIIKHFDAELIDINTDSVIFDKLVVLSIETPAIPFHAYGHTSGAMEDLSDDVKNWRLRCIPNLRNEFLPKEINDNKNIYVTRSLINKINSNRVEPHNYFKEYRVHDFTYDDSLDDVFNSMNFSVVEFFNKGFFEQIDISYNSDMYVSINGNGLLNTIWCRPETKIIILEVQKNYKNHNYYWKDIINIVGNNIFKYIDITDMSPNEGLLHIKNEISKL